MKRIWTSLLPAVLLLSLLAGLAGCGTAKPAAQDAVPTDHKEELTVEDSVQLLMSDGGLEEDSARGTMETLGELGIPPLQKVEKLSASRGITLRVTDGEGKLYYLGYGGLGYLEIVRRDAENGEILYAPED